MQHHAAPACRGPIRTFSRAALVCSLYVAGYALTLAHAAAPATQFQRWTADAPPTFTLPDLANSLVKLDGKSGQVVLVHFFATWCEPCREELPALNRLAARSQGTLRVLAISVAEVAPTVRRFLERTPLDVPVLLDSDRAVARAWGVSILPSTVVLDATLRPQLVIESDFAWDTIDPAKLVNDLTTRSPSPPSTLKGG